nr:MAG TPA: hypothetical protein [Caudoviricetes sp.]
MVGAAGLVLRLMPCSLFFLTDGRFRTLNH